MTAMADAWIDFWNRPNAIYANRRNLDAHFASLLAGLAPHVPQGGRVLDFGCGEALNADVIAARAGTLVLYDAAPAVRERLRGRYPDGGRITVAELADLEAQGAAGFDLIIVVSVLQYIPRADLPDLLKRWKSWLAPEGRLLLADIVTPDVPIVRDVASQLTFAWKNGFFLAALFAIVRLALSDYRRIRHDSGFSVYRADEIAGEIAGAGLTPERLAHNIGPTPHRLSFTATCSL